MVRKKIFSDENNNKNHVKTITGSVILFIVVLFLNTFFNNLVFALTGDAEIALMLTVVICAPFVEEAAKVFSIQQKMTGSYFVVFNIAEFLMYFFNLTALGVPVLMVVFGRLLAVLLHLALTMFHVQAKKSKLDPKGSYIIGVIVHALWNLAASQ